MSMLHAPAITPNYRNSGPLHGTPRLARGAICNCKLAECDLENRLFASLANGKAAVDVIKTFAISAVGCPEPQPVWMTPA